MLKIILLISLMSHRLTTSTPGRVRRTDGTSNTQPSLGATFDFEDADLEFDESEHQWFSVQIFYYFDLFSRLPNCS